MFTQLAEVVETLGKPKPIKFSLTNPEAKGDKLSLKIEGEATGYDDAAVEQAAEKFGVSGSRVITLATGAKETRSRGVSTGAKAVAAVRQFRGIVTAQPKPEAKPEGKPEALHVSKS
jgi:hypothetical protein